MAHEHGITTHGDSPRASHELGDINFGAVIWSGVVLIVFTAIVYVLVWLLFGFFARGEARRGVQRYPLATGQDRLPLEPRLQTNPRQDLHNLRANEDRILNSYDWVDKSAGTVRIPIGEAMKLTVERGLPAREGSK